MLGAIESSAELPRKDRFPPGPTGSRKDTSVRWLEKATLGRGGEVSIDVQRIPTSLTGPFFFFRADNRF